MIDPVLNKEFSLGRMMTNNVLKTYLKQINFQVYCGIKHLKINFLSMMEDLS